MTVKTVSATRLSLMTVGALVCFAGNSVLGRAALLGEAIGPGAFSLIRLLSGAVCLLILTRLVPSKTGRDGTGQPAPSSGQNASLQGDWRGAMALLAYVVFFSFAYLALDAGIGALILFFLVQITMVSAGWLGGEHLARVQWGGLVLSLASLVILLAPARGAGGVSMVAAASMAVAGVAWGLYSLIGRRARDPLRATAGNFARASLIAIALFGMQYLFRPEAAPSLKGVTLAVMSGVLTSGLGYAVWYAVAPRLTAVSAGVAQLSVPVIVATGGMIFLGETLSAREAVSGFGVLLGVWLVVDPRLRRRR